MKICGNGDNFGFKDLQAPTSNRFKRQLSAVINFLKYKEDMQYLVEQVSEEREELFAAVDEVAEQSAALEGELGRVQKLNETKLLEHDQVMAECKEVCPAQEWCIWLYYDGLYYKNSFYPSLLLS